MTLRIKKLLCQSALSIVTVASSALIMSHEVSAQTPCPSEGNDGINLRATLPARELFRKAYSNRYVWNLKFSGFAAAVKVKLEGKEYRGRVRLGSDLKVAVMGIDSTDAKDAVSNTLSAIAVHRRQIPFEVAHKDSLFRYGCTDGSGTVEIYQTGKAEARYKVSKNTIVQVNRVLQGTPVIVDVWDTFNTGEGYIPTRYRTLLSSPNSAQAPASFEEEDTYEKIGGYYVPKQIKFRQVDDKGQTTQVNIDLVDIRLLP